MASSSSTINSCDNYDVFLSFFGKDTRYNFTSHLHKNLCRNNIKVFIDNEIKRGEKITSSLERKIEEAKISIIVLSKNYAESTFCLDELEKIMECKESKGQIVLPIFYKVEPSDSTYEKAFDEHKANFCGRKRRREETLMEEGLKKVEKWKSAFREAMEVAGWHIKEESGEADIIEKVTDQVLTNLLESNGSQSKEEEFMCTSIVGYTTDNIFKEIWDCLMNESISRVGIYGMGGVGKTSIATRVYDELRGANCFTHVCWVTVSKDLSIWKLQKEIAKTLKLDLCNEDDERKRAGKLRQRLKTEKFVLILDDVWEAFEIEEMGIPRLVGAQKLLLTSRNFRVCKSMKCRPIEVKPLSKEEALDLFMRESENEINDSQEWTETMDSIVNECAGLPLAIVVLARKMRGVVEIREWKNTLRELQKPCDGENQEVEKKVFRSLKFSYDRLSNDMVRQCFLYCSLFPEDFKFERDDLITCLIGEGIINELDCRQEELDKGHCIIDELINASLLEHYIYEGMEWLIKMHDVVRDMGQIVIRENFKAQEDGLKVQGETKKGVNLKSVVFIEESILEKGIPKLPPNCSKLTTLSFCHVYIERELPSCFFANMQNLAVLDMRGIEHLKLLPYSTSYLGNLRVLLLDYCISLEYIPSLAGLKNLWHLDLSNTNLREMPIGMERLINLRVLKLSWYYNLDAVFPGAFLEKLSHLQILKFEKVEVEADVLISLKKLETLRIDFYNLESLNLYFKSGHWKRLEECCIVHSRERGAYRRLELEDCRDEHKKVLYIDFLRDFGGWKGETDLVLPNNIQKLVLEEWNGPMVDVVMKSTFHNLRHLEIRRCEGVQHVLTSALAQTVLLNVEILIIDGDDYWKMGEVDELEEIISAEEELVGEINNYTTIHFPYLKHLKLRCLRKLRSIYKGRMACPSLEGIEITKCGKLERLPFCMKEKNKHNLIQLKVRVMPNEWWDSLQWDDPNCKSIYQFKNFPKDDDPSTSYDDDPMEEVDLTLKL